MRVRNESGAPLVLPTLEPPVTVADGEEFDLPVAEDALGPVLPLGVVPVAKTNVAKVERAERKREQTAEDAEAAAHAQGGDPE